MKFDLENYAKTQIPEPLPAWVKSETTQRLYLKANELFEEAKLKIETIRHLSIKDRRIVLRRIATECSVDPSLLTTRRQPELLEYVVQKNNELEQFWTSITKSRYTSGRRLNKQQLEKKVRALTTELEHVTNLKLSDALTSALAEKLIETKSELIATIEDLQLQVKSLEEKVRHLREDNKALINALNKRKSD
ncbi:hypothetical protein D3C77_170610 [compost metagenome]